MKARWLSGWRAGALTGVLTLACSVQTQESAPAAAESADGCVEDIECEQGWRCDAAHAECVRSTHPVMEPAKQNVVADAACSSRNILGTPLPGCCDQTGVCGVSTAPVAAGSPGAIPGLNLPVTCVSPAEAAQLGGGMAALGSEAPQACGGASGSPDAGTPSAPEQTDAGASG